jgi:hypothetical protein
MTAEDHFEFTLNELQMLKVCTEWYHTYETSKGNHTYDFSDISARVGKPVDQNDFAQLVNKLERNINGLALR